MNPIYTIHTDGSCLKNPGGYGGIGVIIAADGFYREIGEGFPAPTTNNQMEIMAAIQRFGIPDQHHDQGLETEEESGYLGQAGCRCCPAPCYLEMGQGSQRELNQ
jgi:hypothetical protein